MTDSTLITAKGGESGRKINDPQMLPVGATLQGGKYKVVAQLAHGGFGKTYIVWDKDLEVNMALKELFIRGINERRNDETSVSLVVTADTEMANQNNELFQSQQKKFRDEARRLFKLLHPNIVRVHACFEENNTSYYVMDYIDGESLSARLNRLQRPLTEDELMPLLPEILNALEYIHNKRIWHLDLKPANIMVDAEGHPHLIDFGASKQLVAIDERTSTISNLALTQGYAPPEQEAQDIEDLGPWTDFYALGATMYKLLTNVEKLPSAAKRQSGYELVFPDGVSQRTRSLILWMMKLSRVERPRSVEDIRAFLREESQPATDVNDEKTIIEVAPKKPVKNDGETIIEQELSASSKTTTEPEPVSEPKPKPIIIPIIITLFAVVALGLGAWWITKDNDISENMVEAEKVFQADDIEEPLEENEPYTSTPQPSNPSSQTFTANGVSFKMIRVDGGTFTMGATPEQEDDAYDREKPAHQVTLSSYYIGETEVTQALWEAVMGTTISQQRDRANKSWSLNGVGDNYPMYFISWEECQAFIGELNRMTGKKFRLPTEAEWEYAARGGNKGTGCKYSGSDAIDKVAWYDENSGSKTHPVKTKFSNELGIYYMSGNVWEWCQDWYGSYSASSQTNPKGASTGSYRVFRGGGWGSGARSCRVSDRGGNAPGHRSYGLGFRLAL